MERRYYLRGLGVGIAVTALVMGVMTSRSGRMTDQEVIARAKELGMVENTVLLEEKDGEADRDGDTETEEDGTEEDEAEDAEQAGGEESVTDAEKADAEGQGGDAEQAGEEDGRAAERNAAGQQAGTEDGRNTGSLTEASAGRGTGPDAGSTSETRHGPGTEAGEAGEEEDSGSVATEEEKRELITSAAVKTITVSSGDGSHTVAQKLADAGVIISAQSFDDFLCQYGYDKKLRTGTFSIPADASDEQIARIVTGAE